MGEYQLQGVNAITYHASEVQKALLKAKQDINNPVAKVEAQEEEEVGSYLLCRMV